MHKQKQDNYKTGLTQNFGRPVLSNGFTLVELIVVITILAILGTIAIMAFSGYSKNARDSARISDIGNMKKSLELWILQSGTYPDPSSGTGVTYSGATVWQQGTFGDSVTNTVGKLDKKPVDPLYEVDYTYSVTTSKKEYQIGAVLEKNMAYSSPIFPQTYAATSGEAYVSGTYNGILTTVGTNPTYILALPSIILSDINNVTLEGPTSLVYEGKSNLPSSYANKSLTMTGIEFSFSPTVVWSGSSLTELNSQTGFQDMVSNLQEVYTNNSAFASLPEYTSIVTGDMIPSETTMSFVKDLVQTNTSTELTNVSINYVVQTVSGICTGIPTNATYYDGSINYALINAQNGTSLLATYSPNPSNNTCEYKCNQSFSGNDCSTPTIGTYENPGLTCNNILQNRGGLGDGFYYILPTGYTGTPIKVYCDMTTDGGGWTLIMHGLGGNTTGWGTNNALNDSNPTNTGSTFKYSDVNINYIRAISTRYKLESVGVYGASGGPYPLKYFMNASCVYGHVNTFSSGECIKQYSDVNLSTLVKTATAPNYYQTSSISMCSYNDCTTGIIPTLYVSGIYYWFAGPAGAGDGHSCASTSVGCDINVWLR